MDERVYLVEGSMKLSDINDELDTELSSEDYDSIGGLIIEYLDRLPEDGEIIITDEGISLQVQGVNQNRIVKVLMTLPEKRNVENSGKEEGDLTEECSSNQTEDKEQEGLVKEE